MAVAADDLGDRGQGLFCLLMTQICPGRNEPYFRPRFLGDKYPTFDYLVELVGREAYFFFVQVKSTRQGFRQGRGERRLRVNVTREDVQRMIASPIPTYVVGIDEPQGVGYLLSMNEPRQTGLGGLPARHLLSCENLSAPMTKQEPWFIEERALAFASLALTNRHEVQVRPYAGRDVAINLLIEILKDGKSTLRFFGAQLIGYLDLPALPNADERVFSHLGRDPFEAGLPLCAFVIGVRKPEGLYRWVVEPMVDKGRAILQHHTFTQNEVQRKWQPLDDAGADRLIAQVNPYYEALTVEAPPKPTG